MALSKELLDILACPKCKGDIELLADESGLVCRACSLQYPIREGIPVMLLDEAEKVGE
ncbi:MAG: Trm112 family protein [Geobacter sp.]|nr:Trm112 family protein [Geobacter sp.]